MVTYPPIKKIKGNPDIYETLIKALSNLNEKFCLLAWSFFIMQVWGIIILVDYVKSGCL